MRIVHYLVVAATVSGCVAAVEGQFDDGPETFTGRVAGYDDSRGTITITSKQGISCSGDFDRGNFSDINSYNQAKGTLSCSNGEMGPFEFRSVASRAHGTACIGKPFGRPFKFWAEPVRGAFDDSSETFTGSATGLSDGRGTLTISGDKGLSCSGEFDHGDYAISISGYYTAEGTLKCTNGQLGHFMFQKYDRIDGWGCVGKALTFTFR